MSAERLVDPSASAGLSAAAKELLLRPLLSLNENGLYCASGDFYIDPWQPVPRALITHAHSDHARAGSSRYWTSESSAPLVRRRLGLGEDVQGVPYGKCIQFGDALVSFHPAGHVLGSAQIRIEADGVVWVVSGDYKRDEDPTCAAFEPVECDVFVTEATFGLPIYRWEPARLVAKQILAWQEECAKQKRAALLFCYALGKAQRLLAELERAGLSRPVFVHGAVAEVVQQYRAAGVGLPPTERVGEADARRSYAGELVLAPPNAYRSMWSRRFKDADAGFASGWMRVRGARRRRGYDRGFVLSDHADWSGLLQSVQQSKARLTLVTHGSCETLARYLKETGIEARPLAMPMGRASEDASEDSSYGPGSLREMSGGAQ